MTGATVQDCAAEVTRPDGGKDLLISLDREDVLSLRNEKNVCVPEWNVRFDGDFCLVRKNADGAVTNIVLCGAKAFAVDDYAIEAPVGFAEISLAAKLPYCRR